MDYIFYRISYIYIEKYKDNQGYIYSVGIIVLMQLMHIYTVLLIFALNSESFNSAFFEASKNVNYLYSWKTIPILIVLFCNGLYLNKRRYDKLKIAWANEDKKQRNKKGWSIGAYIFLNIVLTMALAIYRSHLYN